jgi:hypothetical protein
MQAAAPKTIINKVYIQDCDRKLHRRRQQKRAPYISELAELLESLLPVIMRRLRLREFFFFFIPE